MKPLISVEMGTASLNRGREMQALATKGVYVGLMGLSAHLNGITYVELR